MTVGQKLSENVWRRLWMTQNQEQGAVYNWIGYNELGYKKHLDITNKLLSPKWPFYFISQPVYNKHKL